MQELEVKEYHVNLFVQRIVDLVKDGWELKDPESVNYCAQFIGSSYTVHMVKAEKEQPQTSDEVSPVSESPDKEQVQKEEPVKRQQGRPAKRSV